MEMIASADPPDGPRRPVEASRAWATVAGVLKSLGMILDPWEAVLVAWVLGDQGLGIPPPPSWWWEAWAWQRAERRGSVDN
jgi:hypothetical protein